MKKSSSIARVLAFVLLFAFAGASYAALHSSPDTATKIEFAATGLVVAGLSFSLLRSQSTKPSVWKKAVPMIFITLQAVGGQAIMQRAPANIGIGVMPLPAIGANGSNAQGTAQGANGSGAVAVEAFFADMAVGAAVEFSLIITNTFTSNTVIPLLPQYLNDALPAQCTFSSAVFSTYQAFVNYYHDNRTLLDRVTINTTDTTIFTSSLKLTKTLADGNPFSRARTWNSLSKDQYAQDQTVRDFYGRFVTGSNVRYELAAVQQPAATMTVTFTFSIAGSSTSYRFNRPDVL